MGVALFVRTMRTGEVMPQMRVGAWTIKRCTSSEGVFIPLTKFIIRFEP
jgi:hypothetical protein